jgi:hypothetical protein
MLDGSNPTQLHSGLGRYYGIGNKVSVTTTPTKKPSRARPSSKSSTSLSIGASSSRWLRNTNAVYVINTRLSSRPINPTKHSAMAANVFIKYAPLRPNMASDIRPPSVSYKFDQVRDVIETCKSKV